MTIEPLRVKLDKVNNGGKRYNTDPDDIVWYQFVLDHQIEIKTRAIATPISREEFNEVRFDFSRWYRATGRSLQYLWVARLISPNTNDEDFFYTPVVWVPDESYMRELYERYKASSKPLKRNI